MTEISITRTANPRTPPADDTLSFGNVFSDHMFMLDYEEGKGWHSPRIVPYQDFSLDPATCVLHYGQAIFDGLKAFRGADILYTLRLDSGRKVLALVPSHHDHAVGEKIGIRLDVDHVVAFSPRAEAGTHAH